MCSGFSSRLPLSFQVSIGSSPELGLVRRQRNADHGVEDLTLDSALSAHRPSPGRCTCMWLLSFTTTWGCINVQSQASAHSDVEQSYTLTKHWQQKGFQKDSVFTLPFLGALAIGNMLFWRIDWFFDIYSHLRHWL
jgi:hypothetical protein